MPLVSMSLVSPHLNSNHEWAEVTLILIIEKKDLSFTYFGMNTFMKILYNFSVSRATDMDWTGHSHSKGGIELHFMNVNQIIFQTYLVNVYKVTITDITKQSSSCKPF